MVARSCVGDVADGRDRPERRPSGSARKTALVSVSSWRARKLGDPFEQRRQIERRGDLAPDTGQHGHLVGAPLRSR